MMFCSGIGTRPPVWLCQITLLSYTIEQNHTKKKPRRDSRRRGLNGPQPDWAGVAVTM